MNNDNASLALPLAIQAPMCGISDLAYRRIARRYGCGFAFPPMLHCEAIVRGRGHKLVSAVVDPAEGPTGLQLVGTDSSHMAEAARILHEETRCAVIDVNLGCPVRKIVSGGAGAALLKDPDQVGRIVAALREAVPVPVTVKMRQGYAGSGENAFLDVARAAERAGVHAITLHGRIREQHMKGRANWEAIRRLKETVGVPVIGNGDVFSAADAVELIATTGCDAVMVARGALGRPWIYREIDAALHGEPLPAAPGWRESMVVFRDHVLGEVALHGEHTGMLLARKIAAWYVRDIPGAAEIRSQTRFLSTVADLHDVVDRLLALSAAA